jgi:hypothetical protein
LGLPPIALTTTAMFTLRSPCSSRTSHIAQSHAHARQGLGAETPARIVSGLALVHHATPRSRCRANDARARTTEAACPFICTSVAGARHAVLGTRTNGSVGGRRGGEKHHPPRHSPAHAPWRPRRCQRPGGWHRACRRSCHRTCARQRHSLAARHSCCGQWMESQHAAVSI